MSPQQSVNISQELSELEQKKHALEKIYKIARAVEQLRCGLEAIVLLGKPTASISQQALHVYEALSDKIKILPTQKIQQTVVKLDAKVANDLSAVLEAAALQDSPLAEEAAGDKPQHNLDVLIDDYRKNAQTAVALRVVLRERGVPTKPISWPVSSKLLTQRLCELKSRESNYRQKIDTEIVSLQKDAHAVFRNDKLPQTTRDAAAHMHAMLQKDLDHIRAGKNIADMPFFVEVVVVQEKTEQPVTDSKSAEALATPPTQNTAKQPKNLVHKMWLWATTPLSVTWNDINKKH